VISQENKPLHQSLESQSYFTCPSTFADRASADLLSNTAFIDNLIATNCARLARNYKLTTGFLDKNKVPYHKGSNVGFFVWVDLFPIAASAAAAVSSRPCLRGARDANETSLRAAEAQLEQMLLQHRVFLSTGKTFGTEVPGWFRIAFAYETAYLLEGLERVLKATKAFGREIVAGQEKPSPVFQILEEIRPQQEGLLSN